MSDLLAGLGILGGVATLISIIGVFIKVGGIKQEIIEVREDTKELKQDFKAHGSNLQQLREDVATLKGSRIATIPNGHLPGHAAE